MTRIHQDVPWIEQMGTLFQAGSLGGLSDGALLEKFRSREAAGAEAAFAELVKRHGPMVYAACRRILVDPHLAEDALQATFLILARRAASIRNRETLGGWLHRVACRIAWRSRKRVDRRGAKEEPMVEEIAARIVDRAEDVELRAIVDQEIDRLRDAQRLPIVLCCLEGLSHEEASERLRWPLGTLKSRLARGREKLQARLIRRGVAPAVSTSAVAGGLRTAEAAVLSSALVNSTTALAWKEGLGGAGVTAAVAALVSEEMGSALALKLKVGAAVALSGLALASVGSLAPAFLGETSRLRDDARKPAAIASKDEKPKDSPVDFKLSASGNVVDVAGKPIEGARVCIREWSTYRMRDPSGPARVAGLNRGERLNDVVAERSTDADGRFEFREIRVPGFHASPEVGKTEFPWDVIALATGRGSAWARISSLNPVEPITLTLADEGLVHGTVVEPGGKPVAGAKITVFGIDRPERMNGGGLQREDRLDLSWSGFLVTRTYGDGRFMIQGLPVGRVASLVVTEPRHERLVAYAAADAANSKHAPEVFENGSTSILHGDLVLTTRLADHTLRGRVIFEVDGKPAPKATFIHGWELVDLDDEGRFRLEGLVPGKIDLHANVDGSDAAPADVEVVVPETPRETEYTLVLPRGLIVRGRVVDGASGKGVGNVKVRYTKEPRSESRFGFEAETDAAGRYRMVVPAGSGFVDVTDVPEAFRRAGRRYTGEPPGASYSRIVDGKAGQTIELVDIPLRRAGESSIRVVDEQGRPVFHAEVRLHDPDPRRGPPPGRTDAEGRYRLSIRNPSQSATIDVLNPDRSEGGTAEVAGAEVAGSDSPGVKPGEIEVRLRPVGSLSGRVLDENGDPLAGATLILYRNVMYPDRPGMSFGKPIETGKKVEKDGRFSFGGLAPGASYSVHVDAPGRPMSTSQHVKIKSGEEARLKDFRLPMADQELTGVIVDPRGRPIPGASISYQHSDRDQALYAPDRAVWFQNADALGRFHLTQLPRGAKRLMAYRNEGTERGVRNLKYADVAAGEREVRIELPDVDGRLRGIE